MSNTILIREAYDWLWIGFAGKVSEEDLCELVAYVNKMYPNDKVMEIGANHRVRFINFVGTIRLNRLQIDIVPKLQHPEEGIAALKNMLHVCEEFPFRHFKNLTEVQDVRMDILSWIAYAYCEELAEQLRGGIPAGYVDVEENSHRLKGRVVLPLHLRNQVTNPTKVFCRYDERTADIPLNQVLYKALLVLQRKVLHSKVRRKVQQLLVFFEEVTSPPDVSLVLPLVRFDRLQSRFEPAFRLAHLILQRLSILQGGTGAECISFLFDVSVLYEKYVGRILTKIGREMGMTVYLQHEKVRLLKNEVTQRNNIQLRPDIVVGSLLTDGKEIWTTVLDTKWKKAERKQEDIYQMYAYVTGYPDATHAVLLYPKTVADTTLQQWTLQADPKKSIWTRTVRIESAWETEEDLRGILQELYVHRRELSISLQTSTP